MANAIQMRCILLFIFVLIPFIVGSELSHVLDFWLDEDESIEKHSSGNVIRIPYNSSLCFAEVLLEQFIIVFVFIEHKYLSESALIPGLRGPDGIRGPPGARGDDGVKGETGEEGYRGRRGAHGKKGARGRCVSCSRFMFQSEH